MQVETLGLAPSLLIQNMENWNTDFVQYINDPRERDKHSGDWLKKEFSVFNSVILNVTVVVVTICQTYVVIVSQSNRFTWNNSEGNERAVISIGHFMDIWGDSSVKAKAWVYDGTWSQMEWNGSCIAARTVPPGRERRSRWWSWTTSWGNRPPCRQPIGVTAWRARLWSGREHRLRSTGETRQQNLIQQASSHNPKHI